MDPRSSIPKNIQENAVELGIIQSEGWKDLEKTHGDVNDVIGNLDNQLNNVLRKQEYEYL